MGKFGTTYKTDDMPKGDNFDAVPAGTYDVTVRKDTDIVDTAAGGKRLKVGLDITGPNCKGRVLWANINLKNANPKAEEIGLREFGDLLRACGIAQIDDTDRLVGKRLRVKVSLSKANDGYGDVNGMENKVKAYYAIEGQNAPSAPPAPAPVPGGSSGGSPAPWLNNK